MAQGFRCVILFEMVCSFNLNIVYKSAESLTALNYLDYYIII